MESKICWPECGKTGNVHAQETAVENGMMLPKKVKHRIML